MTYPTLFFRLSIALMLMVLILVSPATAVAEPKAAPPAGADDLVIKMILPEMGKLDWRKASVVCEVVRNRSGETKTEKWTESDLTSNSFIIRSDMLQVDDYEFVKVVLGIIAPEKLGFAGTLEFSVGPKDQLGPDKPVEFFLEEWKEDIVKFTLMSPNTGKPVANQELVLHGRTPEHTHMYHRKLKTDEEGQFEISVPHLPREMEYMIAIRSSPDAPAAEYFHTEVSSQMRRNPDKRWIVRTAQLSAVGSVGVIKNGKYHILKELNVSLRPKSASQFPESERNHLYEYISRVENRREVRIDVRDGEFRQTNLEPGEYYFELPVWRGDSFYADYLIVEGAKLVIPPPVKDDEVVKLPEHRLIVRKREKSEMKITVVNDLDGTPVQGAMVTCYMNGTRAPKSTRTDEMGVVVFEEMKEGEYILDTDKSDWMLVSRVIQFSGDKKPIMLRARATSTLDAKLVDEDGNAVTGAKILIIFSSSDRISFASVIAKTDHAGNARIPGVPHGRAHVYVFSESERTAIVRQEVQVSVDNKQLLLNVIMPPTKVSGHLHGRYVDRIKGALVIEQKTGLIAANIRLDEEGNFSTMLPPGDYGMYHRDGEYAGQLGTFTIKPGSTEARVELEIKASYFDLPRMSVKELLFGQDDDKKNRYPCVPLTVGGVN